MQRSVVFEVSWEVCNKMGGIHTALAGKAQEMVDLYGEHYIAIGPSQWQSAQLGFIERNWHPKLVTSMAEHGIPIRCGVWDVPGQPRCILVDFSQLYKSKDSLLEWMWNEFQVDSLSGGWDYVEPVLFSLAAARTIQALAQLSNPVHEQWTAIFHEWMAASGIFVLKREVPMVASVFVTHATVLGRAMAAAGHPFQANGHIEDPLIPARTLHVLAKHSLESKAAQNADCFAAISEVAAREAAEILGRRPDPILFNGLPNEFPDPAYLREGHRKTVRDHLISLAECIEPKTKPLKKHIFMTAGRYEHLNKGVDLSLASLRALVDAVPKDTHVLALFCFPAENRGADPYLLAYHNQPNPPGSSVFSTHPLAHPDRHPGLQTILGAQFPTDRLLPLFVPIYLDGSDELLPFHYEEVLAACDLSFFPSLYDPWGYTPLESLACGVPTVCSNLSGFGQWFASQSSPNSDICYVLNRQDQTFEASQAELVDWMVRMAFQSKMSPSEKQAQALNCAQSFRWPQFMPAYEKAILKAQTTKNDQAGRQHSRAAQGFSLRLVKKDLATLQTTNADQPRLFPFTVHNRLPEALIPLKTMAYNLWWSWQPAMEALYAEVDPKAWQACGHNPIHLLDKVKQSRLDQLAQDQDFLDRLKDQETQLQAYLDAREKQPEIAYFCMEYGIHECLSIYSGGLGILAGDHLKSASDLGTPLLAIGLAFKGGYFKQKLDHYGQQFSAPFELDFHNLPMTPIKEDQAPQLFHLPFPGRMVAFQVWRVQVGSVSLYLLDTDVPENRKEDREITRHLYGGNNENRLKQEFLLGVGGRHFMDRRGIKVSAYHMNEGHASFLVLSRLYEWVHQHHLDFESALELVRQTSLFTTHTPVPAGHDVFHEDAMRPYFSAYAEWLHVDWSQVMALGRYPQHQRAEDPFSMTLLGLRGSGFVNGVSQIHAAVSKQNFHSVLPGYLAEEVPVRAITNGVHVRSWLAPEFQDLVAENLGPDWESCSAEPEFQDRIRNLPNDRIEAVHAQRKSKLLQEIRRRIEANYRARHDSPRLMNKIINAIQDQALLVGFARRFAPYKRATLLFSDQKALERLLYQENRPLIFVFAGKAHPADTLGQNLIKTIFERSRERIFHGRILLLEDYDIGLSKLLVSGCDIWLNTPTRPLEASGTSGMKAAMNGVLNFSVPDGWWGEGYNGKNGWSLGGEQLYEKQELQDEFDSQQLYYLFRQKVLPLFHPPEGKDRSTWLTMMKESMASTLYAFSTRRMLTDYEDYFYDSAQKAAVQHRDNQYQQVKRIGAIKRNLRRAWANLRIDSIHMTHLDHDNILTGTEVDIQATVSHPQIDPTHLQVEFVFGDRLEDGSLVNAQCQTLKREKGSGDSSEWHGTYLPQTSGALSFGIRVRPHLADDHSVLDLDLDLVRWA